MNTQPTISMRAFFALPAVVAQQEIQKANAHGTPEHRAAFDALVELARQHGVESFFPEY